MAITFARRRIWEVVFCAFVWSGIALTRCHKLQSAIRVPLLVFTFVTTSAVLFRYYVVIRKKDYLVRALEAINTRAAGVVESISRWRAMAIFLESTGNSIKHAFLKFLTVSEFLVVECCLYSLHISLGILCDEGYKNHEILVSLTIVIFLVLCGALTLSIELEAEKNIEAEKELTERNIEMETLSEGGSTT